MNSMDKQPGSAAVDEPESPVCESENTGTGLLRAHREFIKDAGWGDYWYFVSYRLRNWRCNLFGHALTEPQPEYEDIYLAAYWRECSRPACDYYEHEPVTA